MMNHGMEFGRARQPSIVSGWYCEMQIPFSQMRFSENEKHTWGVNFHSRDISRKNEIDYLVYGSKNEQVFVSRFFDLTGIEDIKSSSSV